MASWFYGTAQVNVLNNNATIRVNNGVHFRVNGGSITNQNNAEITNDGNIYLDLNFNQNNLASYTGGGSSWLWFEGGTNQNITGDAPLAIARLRVDNANRVILANRVNVSHQVDFRNNTKIELGNNNLVLVPGASVTNYDENNYVLTNGLGMLQQEAGATAVVFPVGVSTYNPATVNNSGTIDNFSIRVFEQVLNQGTTGLVETSAAVNRTWMIEEETTGGANVELTLQWEQTEELMAFNRANSGIEHHLVGLTWDKPSVYTPATNQGGTTWTQTRSGFTNFSPFVVRSPIIDLPVELLDFKAKRITVNEVELVWNTASELNNHGFEIQRMLADETAFQKIAWVDGNGTTSSNTRYAFIDQNSYTGVAYYRLKQIDFDGSFAYSETRAVNGSDLEANSSVFPNPTKGIVYINLPINTQPVLIQLLDSKGAAIGQKMAMVQEGQLLQLDQLEYLADGVYWVRITTETGKTYSHKIIKKGD